MKDWIEKAIAHSRKTQAQLQRELAERYPAHWNANNRSKLGKFIKGEKLQKLKAYEMHEISEVTGYPMPDDETGETSWKRTIEQAIDDAKVLGASSDDIIREVLRKVPVRLISADDQAMLNDFAEKHPGKLSEAEDDLSKIPHSPRER